MRRENYFFLKSPFIEPARQLLDYSHRLFLLLAGGVPAPITHFISFEVGNLIETL